jgi:hypothetical protein
MTENIMHEAIHEILEDNEFDQLLDKMKTSPMPRIYASDVNDEPVPNKEFIKPKKASGTFESDEEDMEDEQVAEYESINPGYEKMLKEVTAVDEQEIFRKRMFLNKPFTDLMEFMLEDTLFNLMEEATYDEFDLTQPPKIYIRKN